MRTSLNVINWNKSVMIDEAEDTGKLAGAMDQSEFFGALSASYSKKRKKRTLCFLGVGGNRFLGCTVEWIYLYYHL